MRFSSGRIIELEWPCEKMNPSIEKDERADVPDTIASAILQATETLRVAGVPEARREAGSLLAHVLRKDRTFIISHADELLTPDGLETFRSFVQRRASGEPQQYITGYQDFFGLTLEVTPDVLIPRPETELLVEAALGLISSDAASLICDVGTGSGCIPIAILNSRANARAIAIDISEAALKVAQVNASRYQMEDRISFVVSDCFEQLDHQEFDLIVSNPPYVSAAAFSGLQREVRDHEPVVALSPGGDGLLLIRRLVAQSSLFLKVGGHVLFEIGFDQGEAVRELIDERVWQLVDIKPDLQGIPRIVALQKQ